MRTYSWKCQTDVTVEMIKKKESEGVETVWEFGTPERLWQRKRKKKSKALCTSADMSAVNWTNLSEDVERHAALMAWIRATNQTLCYWQLTARSNTLRSCLSDCLCASLFRCAVQFPNQRWLFYSVNTTKGQRRFQTAMMYKLMGRESGESGYVPEQLVDLIMRSPEMSSTVAPRHN